MFNNITLDELNNYLKLFNKMYDAMRLVDPINKKVIENLYDCSDNPCEKCYEYWGKGKICDNCISTLAYQDNECYMKLEQSIDSILCVTSLPIKGTEHPLVLELLKDVSDTMMIGFGDYASGRFVRDLIHDINELAVKDEITKIFNRRYADDCLPKNIVKAAMEKCPLSVIFLDVDNLKEINDTLGHAFGDATLKKVADVIISCIRINTDWVARYGGDEFLICLYNTAGSEAYEIAERIRNKISEIVILQDEKIKTTASLGIYSIENTQLTAAELILLADNKMYEAKKKGKNCTVI